MRNIIKKSFYTTAWVSLVWLNTLNVFAWAQWTFGQQNANTLAWSLEQKTLEESIQGYVNFLMTFLYLIAVLYALWGWFQILTAWGDDEKVKKWKTILIQWAIWLFVIWIAGTLVKFILRIFSGG